MNFLLKERKERLLKELSEIECAEKIAHNINHIRIKNNLSIKEIAEASGLSEATLYRYESATHPIPVDKLEHIAHGLNCTVEELRM